MDRRLVDMYHGDRATTMARSVTATTHHLVAKRIHPVSNIHHGFGPVWTRNVWCTCSPGSRNGCMRSRSLSRSAIVRVFLVTLSTRQRGR